MNAYDVRLRRCQFPAWQILWFLSQIPRAFEAFEAKHGSWLIASHCHSQLLSSVGFTREKLCFHVSSNHFMSLSRVYCDRRQYLTQKRPMATPKAIEHPATNKASTSAKKINQPHQKILKQVVFLMVPFHLWTFCFSRESCVLFFHTIGLMQAAEKGGTKASNPFWDRRARCATLQFWCRSAIPSFGSFCLGTRYQRIICCISRDFLDASRFTIKSSQSFLMSYFRNGNFLTRPPYPKNDDPQNLVTMSESYVYNPKQVDRQE